MYTRLNNQEYERMTREYDKVKYTCKKCGRRVVIPYKVDKQICSWCGNYVFKTNQEEFKYRVKEYLKWVLIRKYISI